MPQQGMTFEDIENMGVDDDGRLLWKGKPVVTEERITLRGFERVIACLAALGAVLAGIHPFLKSFNFIP